MTTQDQSQGPRKLSDAESRRIAKAFSVGQSIRIKRVSRDTPGDVFLSEILGWRAGAFLVINHPTRNGRFVNLVAGEEYLVSFLYRGVAYGFSSHLMTLQPHPIPIAFLAFPEKIESQVFRKHRRFPVKLDTQASYKGEGGETHQWQGVMTDLSLGGCQLTGREAVPIQGEVILTFQLPGGSTIQDCPAVVRRLNTVNEEYVLGLQFMLRDKTIESRLRALVEEFERIGV